MEQLLIVPYEKRPFNVQPSQIAMPCNELHCHSVEIYQFSFYLELHVACTQTHAIREIKIMIFYFSNQPKFISRKKRFFFFLKLRTVIALPLANLE